MSKRQAPRASDSEGEDEEVASDMELDLLPVDGRRAFDALGDDVLRVEIVRRLLSGLGVTRRDVNSVLATDRSFYAVMRDVIGERYRAFMAGLRRDLEAWGGRTGPGPDIVGRVRAFEQETGVTLERATLMAPSEAPAWISAAEHAHPWYDGLGKPEGKDELLNLFLRWLWRDTVPLRNRVSETALDTPVTRRLWNVSRDQRGETRLYGWAKPVDTHYGYAQLFYLARELQRLHGMGPQTNMDVFYRQLIGNWARTDPYECLVVLVAEASREGASSGPQINNLRADWFFQCAAYLVVLIRLLGIPDEERWRRLRSSLALDEAALPRLFDLFTWRDLAAPLALYWWGWEAVRHSMLKGLDALGLGHGMDRLFERARILHRLHGGMQSMAEVEAMPEPQRLAVTVYPHLGQTRQLLALLNHRDAVALGVNRRLFAGGDDLPVYSALLEPLADRHLNLPPAAAMAGYDAATMSQYLRWFGRVPSAEHAEAMLQVMERRLGHDMHDLHSNRGASSAWRNVLDAYIRDYASAPAIVRLVRSVPAAVLPLTEATGTWLAEAVAAACFGRLQEELTDLGVWTANAAAAPGQVVLDPRTVGVRAVVYGFQEALYNVEDHHTLWHRLHNRDHGGGILGELARILREIEAWAGPRRLMGPEHWGVLVHGADRRAGPLPLFMLVHKVMNIVRADPDAEFANEVGRLLFALFPHLVRAADGPAAAARLIASLQGDIDLNEDAGDRGTVMPMYGNLPAWVLALALVIGLPVNVLSDPERAPEAVAGLASVPYDDSDPDLYIRDTLLRHWLPWVRDAVALIPGALVWDRAMAVAYLRAVVAAETDDPVLSESLEAAIADPRNDLLRAPGPKPGAMLGRQEQPKGVL